MSEQATVKATLHLEVRSRKSKEQRVYTHPQVPGDPEDKTGILNFIRTSEDFYGTVYQSVTRLLPESYNPETKEGTYRASYRRSDRFVDDLELYGWTRRYDLEPAAETGEE